MSQETEIPITQNNVENESDINCENNYNESIPDDTISVLSLPVELLAPSVDMETLKQILAETEKENITLKEQCALNEAKVLQLVSSADGMTQKHQIELEEAKKRQVEKGQEWLDIEVQLKQKHEKEKEMHEQTISTILVELTSLNDKRKTSEKREETLKSMEKNIRICQYSGIHLQVMHDCFLPRFDSLVSYVKESVPNIDEYFIDQIPKVTFEQMNDATYTITVRGFPAHHTAFVAAKQRIYNLSNSVNSAKEFYQRDINRIIRLTTDTLMAVQGITKIWKQYCTALTQLLQEKSIEYVNRFNVHIKEKSRSLIEQSICGTSTPPWIELPTCTNLFRDEYPFKNEIEGLKHQALDEFIKQNISFQRLKFDQIPTKRSVNTIKEFISQIQLTFRTNKKYEGYELKHFSLIPDLLQQIMIYYSCYAVQLPLFESSKELLDKIDKNTVTTITTSTGSGKSTLLPSLLIAEGYDKVIVTQPRRLPCRLISKRVNETIQTDTTDISQKLAGWAVSGAKENQNAKILYITDGLLKERLLHDENFITADTRVAKSIVLFIDEVHERSVNIDLCLALLARILAIRPNIQSKLKIIVSSATLDSSVPNLFRNIPNISFTEFEMPQMGTRYSVNKIARRNENVLDVVLELYKKRERHDQILCFVNSVSEVNQCCRLLAELSHGTIDAVALVQSQSPKVQEKNLETRSVFFSTTVAETSLTFPSLKYVVDTGMINVPVYDSKSKRTVLCEVRAAESTIKQRLGRLDQPYPTPHICQSDLTAIEFSLRRSPVRSGLHYMQKFFPDKPSQDAINMAVDELTKLGILEMASSNQFTQHGACLAKLPDFGSLAMSKAVLAALETYHCGRDLICLSSILSVLNTTNVLKGLPQSMKNPDGDFMSLLNIMNDVLLVKQSVQADQFDPDHFFKAKGLSCIGHIIKQALDRYTGLQAQFNQLNDYRQKAQTRSGKWELVAKSLLAGYSDNIFVSMKELQEKTHQYGRYKNTTDLALLDLQSTLVRPISEAPVCVVLARDVRYSTAVRSTAILSFVGEIKPSWIECPITRNIEISEGEVAHLRSNNLLERFKSKFSKLIHIILGSRKISLDGKSGGNVFNVELAIRKQIVTSMTFELKNECEPGTSNHMNLSRNLDSITKMPYIFNPMKWRWEARKQVKITINANSTKKTCEITLEGRDSENRNCHDEFQSFMSWLKHTAVIRLPHSGVLPRLLHPKMRKAYPDIEKNVARITDSKRTMVDLYNSVKGRDAKRETRMEAVAWIAVCKFNCKLEGGFVRDWVIGNNEEPQQRTNNPTSWIKYQTNSKGQLIPYMDKDIVPSDLDCHLPLDRYFDIDKFRDELYKVGITCEIIREDWRYVLLIDKDEPTGPFTMDLIEPHVTLAHDRIDLDVSNLSLEKDYPREIGMRIDITQSPYSIELETIIENIKSKNFQVLRPLDALVNSRVKKMEQRKWTQLGEPSNFIPRPYDKYNFVLVPLPRLSTLYQALSKTMNTIGPSVKIVSMDEIKNPFLEDTYEGMKKIIARQCKGNPNEQKRYHGTKGDAINGILENGFDDRFFSSAGAWGKRHGAYFADDPRKSHNYTAVDPINKTRVIFYNKVILGKESIMNQADRTLTAAPQDFHSVRGTQFQYPEYIVYRFAQALPYIKITYTK
ncbi:unnamed protein product [Rotaria magnacalcarata]|uniref:Poly [ADP-ribose] polymerase n=2 Tax=Rotaria magnacalcarata TaxID=392030 RepID=A0A816YLE9_9BILA|nr:unnamed protein product [Rotaria magnacalcarata]